MEQESSLPHSQKHATRPYSEPSQSRRRPTIPRREDPFEY